MTIIPVKINDGRLRDGTGGLMSVLRLHKSGCDGVSGELVYDKECGCKRWRNWLVQELSQ